MESSSDNKWKEGLGITVSFLIGFVVYLISDEGQKMFGLTVAIAKYLAYAFWGIGFFLLLRWLCVAFFPHIYKNLSQHFKVKHPSVAPPNNFELGTPSNTKDGLFLPVKYIGGHEPLDTYARAKVEEIIGEASSLPTHPYVVPWDGPDKDHTRLRRNSPRNLLLASITLNQDGSGLIHLQTNRAFAHEIEWRMDAPLRPAYKISLSLAEYQMGSFWIFPETRRGPLRFSKQRPESAFPDS